MTGTIVVPCAGASARFAAAGYPGHKALLPITAPMGRKPMLDWVLHPFENRGWTIVIGVIDPYVQAFAELRPRDLIARIPSTRGQSQTLFNVIEGLDLVGPLVVVNCDVVFAPYDVETMLRLRDNAVAVHDHPVGEEVFSYVNDGERAHFFSEKRRIGASAQSGMWRFSEAQTLRDALRRQQSDPPNYGGEWYLSGALAYVDGGLLKHRVAKFADLGTPEAIRELGYAIG